MKNLIDYLNAETVDALKARLAVLDPKGKKPNKKEDLINLIKTLLETPHLKDYWKKLSTIDQKAIAEVIHNPSGCTFDKMQFFAKYHEDAIFSQASDKRYYQARVPTLLGTFFFGRDMPIDLHIRFKSFVGRPKDPTLEGSETLPALDGLKTKKMELSALTEIKAILKLIDTQSIKISNKTNYPSATALKSAEQALYGGDFYSEENQENTPKDEQNIGAIRAFAWLMLIQAGKLAHLSGSALKLTAAGKKALTSPPEEVLKKLWGSWLGNSLLDEFRRIEAIKGQTGKGKREFTAPSARRFVIGDMLSKSPTHCWIKFDDFSRFILSTGMKFELTKGAPWNLYIGDPEHGSLGYTGFANWHVMQERYMLCFLFEYAATLGLIDVAYMLPMDARKNYRHLSGIDNLDFLSRYDGFLYFQINNLGRYCLGMDEQYKTTCLSSPPEIKIDASGVINVSSENVLPEVISMLEEFCEKKSGFSWILTQESLISAMETGSSLSKLLDFFSKHAVILPKNLEILLRDFEEKSTQIRLKSRVVLFECTQPQMATYFSKDPKIGQYCNQVSDRLLSVPEGKLSKFQSEMKKKGYIFNV